MSPTLFDATALKDLACEEEWVRRHRDGYAGGADSAALVCGRAIHAGVRAYYDGLDMIAATALAYGDFDAGEDFRTLALAQSYVQMYARVYPVPWGFDVLHNEGYLESAEASGIPDRIVRRHLDGQVYPLELKTTSMFPGTAWQEQWGHSQQAAIQMDLADKLLREQCEWCGEVPSANRSVECAASGLSHQDGLFGRPSVCAGFWLDAIYLSSRKAGPQASDFSRCGPFTYSQALRAELRANIVRQSVRAAELKAGTGAPASKNPNACMRYNKLCTFMRYCLLDPADREASYALALATGELTVKHWNPATRDGQP